MDANKIDKLIANTPVLRMAATLFMGGLGKDDIPAPLFTEEGVLKSDRVLEMVRTALHRVADAIETESVRNATELDFAIARAHERGQLVREAAWVGEDALVGVFTDPGEPAALWINDEIFRGTVLARFNQLFPQSEAYRDARALAIVENRLRVRNTSLRELRELVERLEDREARVLDDFLARWRIEAATGHLGPEADRSNKIREVCRNARSPGESTRYLEMVRKLTGNETPAPRTPRLRLI